jgi:hypothetical protein
MKRAVQFDIFGSSAVGEQRRDAGMNLVLSHEPEDWQAKAMRSLRVYADTNRGVEFTAQDFRGWYERNGGSKPVNLNSWGAFWHQAIRLHIVTNTGRAVKAKMPQSNARRLPVYIARGQP